MFKQATHPFIEQLRAIGNLPYVKLKLFTDKYGDNLASNMEQWQQIALPELTQTSNPELDTSLAKNMNSINVYRNGFEKVIKTLSEDMGLFKFALNNSYLTCYIPSNPPIASTPWFTSNIQIAYKIPTDFDFLEKLDFISLIQKGSEQLKVSNTTFHKMVIKYISDPAQRQKVFRQSISSFLSNLQHIIFSGNLIWIYSPSDEYTDNVDIIRTYKDLASIDKHMSILLKNIDESIIYDLAKIKTNIEVPIKTKKEVAKSTVEVNMDKLSPIIVEMPGKLDGLTESEDDMVSEVKREVSEDLEADKINIASLFPAIQAINSPKGYISDKIIENINYLKEHLGKWFLLENWTYEQEMSIEDFFFKQHTKQEGQALLNLIESTYQEIDKIIAADNKEKDEIAFDTGDVEHFLETRLTKSPWFKKYKFFQIQKDIQKTSLVLGFDIKDLVKTNPDDVIAFLEQLSHRNIFPPPSKETVLQFIKTLSNAPELTTLNLSKDAKNNVLKYAICNFRIIPNDSRIHHAPNDDLPAEEHLNKLLKSRMEPPSEENLENYVGIPGELGRMRSGDIESRVIQSIGTIIDLVDASNPNKKKIMDFAQKDPVSFMKLIKLKPEQLISHQLVNAFRDANYHNTRSFDIRPNISPDEKAVAMKGWIYKANQIHTTLINLANTTVAEVAQNLPLLVDSVSDFSLSKTAYDLCYQLENGSTDLLEHINKKFPDFMKTIQVGQSLRKLKPEEQKAFKQLTRRVSAEMSFFSAREGIEEYGKQATENPKDKALYTLNAQIDATLRFRVLENLDPQHFTVGLETDCCQAIGNAGEQAAVDSFINPLAGVLVLEYKDKSDDYQIVAQSYFHFVPGQGFILDNIEYNAAAANALVKSTGRKLEDYYAALATKVKQLNPGLRYFLCGKAYSKINTELFDTGALKQDPRTFAVDESYSDFDHSNAMNLLKPKFKINVAFRSYGRTLNKTAAYLRLAKVASIRKQPALFKAAFAL